MKLLTAIAIATTIAISSSCLSTEELKQMQIAGEIQRTEILTALQQANTGAITSEELLAAIEAANKKYEEAVVPKDGEFTFPTTGSTIGDIASLLALVGLGFATKKNAEKNAVSKSKELIANSNKGNTPNA